MKGFGLIKKFVLFVVAVCCSTVVWAAGPEFSGVEVLRDGNDAKVSFNLSAPRGMVKSDYSMALQPVITDGEHSVSLRPVVIRGRRAEKLNTRYEWVSGNVFDDSDAIYMRARKAGLDYSDSAPFQPWMD
jgi:hypothetical protein